MAATLYHAPLACSLAARIAVVEAGVELNVEYLNLRTKELEKGGSFLDVNPLGQVSAMELEDGQLLTETATVILWVHSQSANGSFRRDMQDADYFQMIRWLGFCATELHKQIFRIVFYGEATDEVKDRIRDLAPQRFQVLDEHLADKPYLLGDTFTAADAYLTWFFVLAGNARLDASGYHNLHAYKERVLNRPLIKELIASDRIKDKELDQQIIPE